MYIAYSCIIFTLSYLVRGQDDLLNILGIDLSKVKEEDRDKPPPPPERVWAQINYEMLLLDKAPPVPSIRLGDWLKLERDGCEHVVTYAANSVIHTTNEVGNIHSNYTGTGGLYYLLQGHIPSTNHYHWLLAATGARIQQFVSNHVMVVVSVLMGSPDCFSVEIRTVFAKYLVRLRDAISALTNLHYSGTVFGILGDVVEGDIDENGDIGDPDSVAVWTKDTTFHMMWTATILRQLEVYAEEIVPLLQTQLSFLVTQRGIPREEPAQRLKTYHHSLGEFAYLEALKRTTFGTWVLDVGLLQGIMRHIVLPTRDRLLQEGPLSADNIYPTICDLGAGGGHYSKWLNDTAIVHAYAFDAIPNIKEITSNAVTYLNLADPDIGLPSWVGMREMDWVISLEVAEHVPPEHTKAMLQTWARLCRLGVVVSWSEDTQGIGHINPQPFEEVKKYMALYAPQLVWDPRLTALLRGTARVEYISRTVAVFRKMEG